MTELDKIPATMDVDTNRLELDQWRGRAEVAERESRALVEETREAHNALIDLRRAIQAQINGLRDVSAGGPVAFRSKIADELQSLLDE